MNFSKIAKINYILLSSFILLSLSLLVVPIRTFGDTNQEAGISRRPLYIDKVNLVDLGTGNIIPNRQLKIVNGKIAAITAAKTPITEPADIHDAQGKFVMPGLIDMHVHAYDTSAFALSLSHGVTHVRIMNGVKDHLAWREELTTGKRLGSTLSVSSPIISGFKNAYMHSPALTPEEARTAVRKAKERGYDLIKAYGNLSAPVLEALIDEASRMQIPVAKHGPHPSGDLPWTILAGMQSLEHVEDIYQGILNHQQDDKLLEKAIENFKVLNVPISPTLNIYWQLTQISDQKQKFLDSLPPGYTSPIIDMEEKRTQVARWLRSEESMVKYNQSTFKYLQHITRELHKAHVSLLVGSDAGVLLSPHGLATINEMRLMSEAGVPLIDVLRAATLNAAKALNKEAQLGKIAVGFNADILLTEKNPLVSLEAISDLSALIKNGKFLTKSDLLKLRQQAIDNRSFWQELKALSGAGA